MRIQNAMQRAEGIQPALKPSAGNVSPTIVSPIIIEL